MKAAIVKYITKQNVIKVQFIQFCCGSQTFSSAFMISKKSNFSGKETNSTFITFQRITYIPHFRIPKLLGEGDKCITFKMYNL